MDIAFEDHRREGKWLQDVRQFTAARSQPSKTPHQCRQGRSARALRFASLFLALSLAPGLAPPFAAFVRSDDNATAAFANIITASDTVEAHHTRTFVHIIICEAVPRSRHVDVDLVNIHGERHHRKSLRHIRGCGGNPFAVNTHRCELREVLVAKGNTV